MKRWGWGVIGSLLVSALTVSAAELAPCYGPACQSVQGGVGPTLGDKDSSNTISTTFYSRGASISPAKEAVTVRSSVRSVVPQDQNDSDDDAYDDGCE